MFLRVTLQSLKEVVDFAGLDQILEFDSPSNLHFVFELLVMQVEVLLKGFSFQKQDLFLANRIQVDSRFAKLQQGLTGYVRHVDDQFHH